MRPGIELLSEEAGGGPPVDKHRFYQFKLRMWLSRGDPVRWSEPWGLTSNARIEDEGCTLVTDLRVDRVFLFSGLFYGIQGMHVGGTRKLRIAPHLAYREAGVPGVVPPNALLTVEATVLSESDAA
jgi:hypothetical protein